MILIHGVYNFAAHRVAFRRDWCRRCQAERLAIRVRSFDVLHVYWIPVLPLGFWRRWFCSVCKSRPHAAPGTRRFFKFAAVAILALMSATMWAPMPKAEPWLVWTLRVGLGALTLWTLRWALRHRVEPDVQARLAAVAPYAGRSCAVCGVGEFVDMVGWQCRNCGVEHQPLRGAANPG